MGTWNLGAFANDDAADLLDAAGASPLRPVTAAMRAIADAPADAYLDVDVGAPGWAACELVAMAFGYGAGGEVDGLPIAVAARLRPKEELRRLALEVLPRLAPTATSELAALWCEGTDGGRFSAALDDLRARLEAAAQGPRAVPKLEAGDVVALPGETGAVLVQVLSAREAAVFAGTAPSDEEVAARVAAGAARRVACDVARVLRRGRALGRHPVRKDLRGRKLYASEVGPIEEYMLSQASGAGMRDAPYDEARRHDTLEPHSEAMLLAVARGEEPVARVRSPDEREAALRAMHRGSWARRREVTTPGPFGDVEQFARFVGWMEDYSVANAVTQQRAIVAGQSGYGRPSEDSERAGYAFAGIVALWLGRWPAEEWPAALAGRLPPPPAAPVLAQAHAAATALMGTVLTRDAALRMIWDEAPDGGAALVASVTALREALSR
ncbi:MAG: DUF4259 domain-containing protein [Deltaproteobacteria bacterium]|nr:DUF4259 domain-containing protein [Deltaproteobacteria bacterium]